MVFMDTGVLKVTHRRKELGSKRQTVLEYLKGRDLISNSIPRCSFDPAELQPRGNTGWRVAL